MPGLDLLSGEFEAHRTHLRAVAFRLLGSLSEADDAVQETWLRLNRSGPAGIDNVGGWLTTVVAHICLDRLRARKAAREEPLADEPAPAAAAAPPVADPEREAILAESVGLAVLVVLERLEPAERLAFVLHDMFGEPFAQIAAVLGRSPASARQLASRARRRVRGASVPANAALNAQRTVVEAFLHALRSGDVEGLIAVLDPDVVARVGGPEGGREVRGARNWATGAVRYAAAAQAVHLALIDGAWGLLAGPRGRPQRALLFQIRNGKIAAAEIITDPARLSALSITLPTR